MGKPFSFDELDKQMTKIDPLGSIITENEFSKIDDWISTGNYLLNAQVSGSIFKGTPNSRSIVFSGVSGTGKTFVILNSVREAQKKGYYVIYGDSEAAVDEDIMIKFGIDPAKVRYQPLKTVLQTRHFITNLCATLKEKKKGGFDIPKIAMVIDSLGNLATDKEIGDAMSGSDKRDMTKQQNLKSMFRVITTDLAELKIPLFVANHVYAAIGSYFPQNVQSGGCLIAGTLVQTPEGLIKIEDLQKGDKVITLEGEREVTETFEFEKPTFLVELEDGSKFEVSNDHRFLVNEDWTEESSWKCAEELTENDEIYSIGTMQKYNVRYGKQEMVEMVH